MKTKLLRILLLVAIVFTMNSCSTNPVENPVEVVTPKANSVSYSYDSSELEVMNLINVYRVSIGLKPLVPINYISFKSQGHNEQMIAVNQISHDGFVARSEDIIKVLGAIRVGENVAYNYNSSQAVFDAWIKSPGHRENIEGDFTNFGISIRLDANGRKYFTNIFAKI